MVVSIKLVYYDATAKIDLGYPTYWKVTCKITAGTYSNLIDFGLRKDTQGGVKVDDHFVSIAIWEKSWDVPSSEGTTYTFLWTVVLKDSSGATIDTKTTTTYGKTASTEPDGYFEINGKRSSETATFVVLDGKLNFVFYATKNAEKLKTVYVEVWKAGSKVTSVNLAGTSGQYSNSYTLPEPGTYEVKGFFTWSGSTSAIQKMTITASWGEETAEKTLGLSKSQIIGLVSAFLGIVFIAVGLKSRK